MTPPSNIGDIAHVIQLAVAPVFLLTGVGTLLAVLSNRLGRAVDRSRVLEDLLPGLTAEALALAEEDLLLLSRRTRLIYAAIVLDVACALFICILIAVAFVDAFLAVNLAKVMGALFVLAMLALIASLAAFLREIFLAVDSARQAMRRRTEGLKA
ncbi:MAG: DUF2721 domain-containing protein [Betaproteobacteria bacterium]|nr:DUF2721 domain-containing protein [Betaproteobacteria bacterium]